MIAFIHIVVGEVIAHPSKYYWLRLNRDDAAGQTIVALPGSSGRANGPPAETRAEFDHGK